MRLDQFFVIVNPCDTCTLLSSNNSGKELNAGSFDMLHAYLADCAFRVMQLDQKWSIEEPNISSL